MYDGRMDENLSAAVDALRRCVEEVQGAPTPQAMRERLRRGAEEILTWLDGEQSEDLWSELDRKSRDIAEDLRRAGRLMREQGGGA